jgi:hypothetical protein
MDKRITHRIVINLGSESNANDLEMEQIWSLRDQGLDASKSNKSEQGAIDEDPNNVHTKTTFGDSLQSKAIMTKN